MSSNDLPVSDIANPYSGLASDYRLLRAQEKNSSNNKGISTLKQIGYLTDNLQLTGTSLDQNWRNQLLSALERFSHFLFLTSPNYAGTHLTAAVVSPLAFGLDTPCDKKISAGGRGLNFKAAFEGCICEAAERLSVQDFDPDNSSSMVSGVNLMTGQLTNFPKDHVVRRPVGVCEMDTPPSSAGCGVAQHFGGATESGLLELVERDAVALWWFGGRKGIVADDLDVVLAKPFMGEKQPVRDRWLMELTTDIGLPVMAALSSTAAGTGVVMAAAAGWTRQAAAAKAALELSQMEMAAALALGKQRALGDRALLEEDWLWINRLHRHDASACPLFRPEPIGPRNILAPPQNSQALLRVLQQSVGPAYVFDLTRPELGIPCARVILPTLQEMKSGTTSARLEKALKKNTETAYHQEFGPPPI